MNKTDERIIYLKALLYYHIHQAAQEGKEAPTDGEWLTAVFAKSLYEKKNRPGWLKYNLLEQMHNSIYSGGAASAISFKKRWNNLKNSLRWGTEFRDPTQLMKSPNPHYWNPLMDPSDAAEADPSWSQEAQKYYTQSICTAQDEDDGGPWTQYIVLQSHSQGMSTWKDGDLNVNKNDIIKINDDGWAGSRWRPQATKDDGTKGNVLPEYIQHLQPGDKGYKDMAEKNFSHKNRPYCWEGQKRGMWLLYFFESMERQKFDRSFPGRGHACLAQRLGEVEWRPGRIEDIDTAGVCWSKVVDTTKTPVEYDHLRVLLLEKNMTPDERRARAMKEQTCTDHGDRWLSTPLTRRARTPNTPYLVQFEGTAAPEWVAKVRAVSRIDRDWHAKADLNLFIFLSYLFNIEHVREWYIREKVGQTLRDWKVRWPILGEPESSPLKCKDASGQISNCSEWPP